MKMFIPRLGTKLRLEKDWEFSLWCEERNKSLWDMKAGRMGFDAIPWQVRKFNIALVKLTVGDEFTVDRVHIRKDQAEYDSVTMKGNIKHHGSFYRCRFWVLIDDFNNMHAEVIE
jgi:hypothetical protein